MTTIPESEHALAEHIRAERVRFVFVQSAIPIFFSPLAAAILSFALRRNIDRGLLVAFPAGLLVFAIARVLLIRLFPRSAGGEGPVRKWEIVFVTSILVVDLWWGFGSLLLLDPHSLAHRALVFCFVMLMASGHASSYAAHPATVTLGVLALSGPITLYFGMQSDTFHRALAFASIMYLLATFRSIKTLSFFFGRTHRLAHELEKLAKSDFLTSLSNRRAFFEAGEHALERIDRYDHEAALLMLDIDHFKAINDRFGHGAGDSVIRAVAEVIRSITRTSDLAGRLGGEEFAVLLPESALDDAIAAAERLRVAIDQQRLDDPSIRFTASIGVAAAVRGERLEKLMERADAALYDAKRAGRNRVVVAELPARPGALKRDSA